MAEPETLSDPRVLRALAHPVRGRILDEIEATGTVRAADIARELDIPANQASFHLRQLATHRPLNPAPIHSVYFFSVGGRGSAERQDIQPPAGCQGRPGRSSRARSSSRSRVLRAGSSSTRSTS